uniref:Protein xylosyltransferase n=1 Tax=Panagrolaimus sp. ES5 TaxID=591445 RepID=A0AC34FQL7_9BILA
MPWRSYLTRRKLIYGFLAIVGIYLFNTCILIRYLESQSGKEDDIIHRHTDYNGSVESAKCALKDPLITSALSRVKTEECKKSLIDVYCFHSDNLEELDNTCPQFDRSQLNTYLGCYNATNSTAPSLLSGYHYTFSSTNTPKNCIQACFRAGFEIAGVKATSHCFCGNKKDLTISENILDDSNCQSTACSGNHNQTCGGIQATAVYSTGVEAVKRRFPKFVSLPENLNSRKRIKILFLLQLNGRSSRQVIRMLRSIYSKKHLYIVHVDSRQKFMFQEMKNLERDLKRRGIKNFKVLDERFSTIWGGTELLTMFLSVIKNSFIDSSFKDWDYILNLSESDMPLLSLEELEHNLGIHNGKSFLASHGYNTADFIRKQGFLFIFHQCENRMWRIKSRENYFKNMRIDGGSDWVIVHRSLAEAAISNSTITNQLLNYFTTVLLPLEGFFHTLALNSKHCNSVLYKNLRLTNWRRKQGCRCATLKPVVDWCGCSPLAFRGANESRFEMDIVQSKTYFFARKFDSFVDVQPIHSAEKQALRFQPELIQKIESSPVLNSTWIKAHDSVIDYDIPNRYIYEGIAKILFEQWIKGQSFEKCRFQKLLEIWAFKASPESSAHPILTVESSCGTKFQIMVERFNRSKINPDPKMEDYEIIDADFGAGLDLKEEIFRDVFPVFDVNSKVTILLNWKQNQSYFETNHTSPFINIQWWNTVGRLVKHEIVKPYNSIFGGQYAELDLSNLQLSNNIIPGLWSVRLPAKDTDIPVFEIQFPIFPSDRESQLFHKLVKAFYAPKD